MVDKGKDSGNVGGERGRSGGSAGGRSGGSAGGRSGGSAGGRSGGRRREGGSGDRRRRQRDSEAAPEMWVPKTKMGMMVKSGEITNMRDALLSGMSLREVEVVDHLLPNLNEEILNVARVQRTTDSGRRMRFRIIAAVGNGNGFVGVGSAKGKDAGPTIRKAIQRAKLSVKYIKRGCGSWQCECGENHSIPFTIKGKSSSVRVRISPAPKGTGLVSGEIARKILSLSGVKDVWIKTEGRTRSGTSFSTAVMEALENTNYMKITDEKAELLKIH